MPERVSSGTTRIPSDSIGSARFRVIPLGCDSLPEIIRRVSPPHRHCSHGNERKDPAARMDLTLFVVVFCINLGFFGLVEARIPCQMFRDAFCQVIRSSSTSFPPFPVSLLATSATFDDFEAIHFVFSRYVRASHNCVVMEQSSQLPELECPLRWNRKIWDYGCQPGQKCCSTDPR